MVGQVANDAQFGAQGCKIEFKGIALVDDEFFRREVGAQALDDVAIDLDDVQGFHDLCERLCNGRESGTNLDHSVRRAR